MISCIRFFNLFNLHLSKLSHIVAVCFDIRAIFSINKKIWLHFWVRVVVIVVSLKILYDICGKVKMWVSKSMRTMGWEKCAGHFPVPKCWLTCVALLTKKKKELFPPCDRYSRSNSTTFVQVPHSANFYLLESGINQRLQSTNLERSPSKAPTPYISLHFEEMFTCRLPALDWPT